MKPIRAQFAETNPVPNWVWWALIVCALALICNGLALRREARELHAQIEQRQEQVRQAAEAKVRADEAMRPQRERDEELAKLRQVQWPAVLTAVETATGDDVRVTQLTIDVKARSATLSAVGPDAKTLIEYAEALDSHGGEASPRWYWALSRVSAGERDAYTAELRAQWRE